jgi:hypothetical protein
VTVTIGVTNVNNPNPVGTLGTDEESDADLKIRRQSSLAIGSTNSLDSMLANLLAIDGVSDAYVHENYSDITDAYGAVEHSMWAIVEGGADADIAQAIYARRSGGCNMNGAVTENVLRPNGEYFPAQFDRPIYDAIFIRFTLTAKTPGATYVASDVKTALVAALDYTLFEEATSSEVTNLLATITPDFIPTVVEVSTNGSNWFEILTPTTPQEKFTIATGNITIT